MSYQNQWHGAGAYREPPPKPEDFKIPIAPSTVIKVYTADITRLEVDAVVNASNENLKHLGGVAGALLSAAGPQLQTACDEYLYQQKKKELQVGEVMHTGGYRLKAPYVIHAVGPNGNQVRNEQQFRDLLQRTIRNTFREAKDLRITALALPLISSGLYFSIRTHSTVNLQYNTLHSMT